ncbi:MAG: hypothetical protein Q9199_001885 [Rusavskia elegans]
MPKSRRVGVRRWSLYNAPNPTFVVSVAEESDVATTVQYCNKKNISFFAQSRGNGWADTFDLSDCSLMINIGGLNRIGIATDKKSASIEGGALVSDMITAAYGAGTRFAVPSVTCLGYLGTMLGGGLTRDMGLYGLGVDQILRVNVVSASGELVTVDKDSNPDLWFAITGAAPNFGIVTSALIKAYPTPKAQDIAWQGRFYFSPSKVEEVVATMAALDLSPKMQIDLFIPQRPKMSSWIIADAFYLGNQTEAEKAFAPIFRIGAEIVAVEELPPTRWGYFQTDFLCQKGRREPAYGVSLPRKALTQSSTASAILTESQEFNVRNPQVRGTIIWIQYYNVEKAVRDEEARPGISSYPFAQLPVHVAVIVDYNGTEVDVRATDVAATAFGSRVRGMLREMDPQSLNTRYVNTASLAAVQPDGRRPIESQG